jgi:exopolyphosphatase/guanosine-5'-triphosphate,3'-diphosphate pyrophosphatase
VIGNYDLKVLQFPDKKTTWKKSKPREKFIAFEWAWNHLSSPNAKRLAALPRQRHETVAGHDVLLTHGGPAKVNETIGPETPPQRLCELAGMTGAEVILCGHTHVPFSTTADGVTFINPGSVGRPEGEDPRACYAMLNLYQDSFTVEFYRVAYDIERMSRAIHAAGLPADFAAMFRTGQNLTQVQDGKVDEYQGRTPDYGERIEQVRRFAMGCGYEAGHSEQVTRLAQRLFDRLAAVHGFGRERRFVLTCAALLHDIGWLEGPAGHHKVAMDRILQDTTLPLTPPQRTLVALIARYHRKALPRDDHPVYGDVSANDQATVRMLAGILRIADGLDRSHMSRVSDVEVAVGPDTVTVRCRTTGPAEPELRAAQKKADLLEQVLSKPIIFRCDPAGQNGTQGALTED